MAQSNQLCSLTLAVGRIPFENASQPESTLRKLEARKVRFARAWAWIWACLAGCAVAVQAQTGSPGAPALHVQTKPARGELTIRYGERPLLVYAFASNQFKPYVRELYSLNGDNLLRDAPPDHLHHHGLMFAIRVNGVNFWEETGEPGVEKSIRLWDQREGRNAQGRPQASFAQEIHWVRGVDRDRADTASVAMLIERRRLTLTVDAATREVALVWQGDFEVGPGTPLVKLHGSAYNGLGLRLPASFDHVARHQNSAGHPYSREQNRDLIAARWSAVSGRIGDHDLMAALFGDARNPGETHFFTMLNPFAYLAATQNLEAKPLDYKAGERFRCRYLLTVYPERKPAAFLEERARRWESP
jgi:Family of unknown function (DUF6807)